MVADAQHGVGDPIVHVEVDGGDLAGEPAEPPSSTGLEHEHNELVGDTQLEDKHTMRNNPSMAWCATIMMVNHVLVQGSKLAAVSPPRCRWWRSSSGSQMS